MTKAQTDADAWAIGVDVRGTKVAAGFVDAQGEIHQHTRVPMNSRGTAEEGLAAVIGAIDELLKLAPQTNSPRPGLEFALPGRLTLTLALFSTLQTSLAGGTILLLPNCAPLRRVRQAGK